MNYLFLLLPFCLFTLSYYYRSKSIKLADSGRIPDILEAKRNTTLFLVLAIVSIAAFVIMIQIHTA